MDILVEAHERLDRALEDNVEANHEQETIKQTFTVMDSLFSYKLLLSYLYS